MHIKGPQRRLKEDLGPSLSLTVPHPLDPAGPRGVGREGVGQAGLAPGPPPGAVLLTAFSLGAALPPPRPWARPVFAVGIWAGLAVFHSGAALLAFPPP